MATRITGAQIALDCVKCSAADLLTEKSSLLLSVGSGQAFDIDRGIRSSLQGVFNLVANRADTLYLKTLRHQKFVLEVNVSGGAGGPRRFLSLRKIVGLVDGSPPPPILSRGVTGSFGSVAGFPNFFTSPTRPGKLFVRRPAVRGITIGGFFEASAAEIQASGVRTGRPRPPPKLRQPPVPLTTKAKAPEVKDGVAGRTGKLPLVDIMPELVRTVTVSAPVTQQPRLVEQGAPVEVMPLEAPIAPEILNMGVLATGALLFFFFLR